MTLQSKKGASMKTTIFAVGMLNAFMNKTFA